jgi:Condensation domain
MQDTLERSTPSAQAVRDGLRQAVIPLSDCQRRVWRLATDDPQTMWVQRLAFRFDGPFDLAALAAALRELARRHGTLRTVFLMLDGEPGQCVRAVVRGGLALIDLDALPAARRGAAATRARRAEARLPLDPRRAPLWRAVVIRFGPAEHVLTLTVHHLIFDGWSRAVLCRELAMLIKAYTTNRAAPSPLPPLRASYADLVRLEQDPRHAAERARRVREVAGRLRNRRPPITWPVDRPRPSHTSHRAAGMPFVIPEPVWRDTRAIAEREGLTTFMVGLAALALTIRSAVPTADDITFGLAVANRPSLEAQDLIGPFVNIVVVRLAMPATLTVRGLLRQVRTRMLEAFAHQDVPFDEVMEALEPGTPKASYGPRQGEPLFRMCVDFNDGAEGTAPAPRGLTITAIDADEPKSGCDLYVSFAGRGDTLRGLLLYSAELYERPTALAIVDRLQASFAHLGHRIDEACVEVLA